MIPLGWIEKGGKRSPVRRDAHERCSDANLERNAPWQGNVSAFAVFLPAAKPSGPRTVRVVVGVVVAAGGGAVC